MSCLIQRQVPASPEQERSDDPLPNMDTYNNSKTGRGQGVTSKGGKIHFKQATKERGITSKGGEGAVGRDEWNRRNYEYE